MYRIHAPSRPCVLHEPSFWECTSGWCGGIRITSLRRMSGGTYRCFTLFWGRAPRNVVDLLTRGMKRESSGYVVDWRKMLETFCSALAPTSLPGISHRDGSRNRLSDLQSMDVGNLIGTMCTHGGSTEVRVELFANAYESSFPEHTSEVNRSVSFFNCILKEKFGFKPFWLRG